MRASVCVGMLVSLIGSDHVVVKMDTCSGHVALKCLSVTDVHSGCESLLGVSFLRSPVSNFVDSLEISLQGLRIFKTYEIIVL